MRSAIAALIAVSGCLSPDESMSSIVRSEEIEPSVWMSWSELPDGLVIVRSFGQIFIDGETSPSGVHGWAAAVYLRSVDSSQWICGDVYTEPGTNLSGLAVYFGPYSTLARCRSEIAIAADVAVYGIDGVSDWFYAP